MSKLLKKISFLNLQPTTYNLQPNHREQGFSMIEVIFVAVLMLIVLVWSGIFSPPKSDIVDSKIHYVAPNTTTNSSNEKNLQITDLKLEESEEAAPTPTPTRSPI